MAEIYQYRDTYRGSRKVPAATVALELERLGASGDVTAERMVVEAEPADSPLHAAFEWDDTIAGRQFRLIQARTIIRAVVTVSDRSKASQSETSIFVHVPARDGAGKYVPLAGITQDIDEYERALVEAQKFLDSAEQRFYELRRLAEMRGGKAEALAIAIQGFAAVRQAVELLR